MSSSMNIVLSFFLVWSEYRLLGIMATCTSQIFCEGPLLDAVQRARLYNDSKTFVDMPLKYNPEVVVQEFDKLQVRGNISKEDLQKFVDSNFLPPGHELEVANLTDWNESPALLSEVADENLREWASSLNTLWKTLARKVKDEVAVQPNRYSLLYVPNPFISPGERFREFYYWDTYWIVKGLLSVNMTTTVKGILENFLYIFKEHGLIPNGGRIYYLNRSQPPLLIPMMYQYYKATDDLTFIRDSVAALEQEYQWWMKNRAVEVTIDNTAHTVNRYNVQIDQPRPEGYVPDIELTEGLSKENTTNVLSSVASACESGQDFSSRWFAFAGKGQPGSLKSIRTRHIVPVDLNVYLGLNENILSTFFKELGDDTKHSQYKAAFDKRLQAINSVFWDSKDHIWYDFDLETKERRPQFYPSNVFPLLMYHHANQSDETLQKLEDVMTYLKREKVLKYPGGIPSSRIYTGQQWDFPNVWSPQLSLVIEALNGLTSTSARQMAYDITKAWVKSNYETWKKYGQMFEKYDAEKPNQPGGGGEYSVQAGFGWTNGFILTLLDHYGSVLKSDDQLMKKHHSSTFIYIFITVVCGIVVFAACIIFCQVRKVKTRRRRKRLSGLRDSSVITFFDRADSK